jgi:hypothetical protein
MRARRWASDHGEMDSFPSGHLRVSDAERDRAISDLSEHFQAGRLTMEEFEERSDQALHAKTYADLAVLFHDLPRARRPAVPAADRRPTPPAPSRLVPLVATLVSALVAVAVSLLSVAEPHHRFVVVAPIVLWLFVIRRLVRVYGPGGPGNGPDDRLR